MVHCAGFYTAVFSLFLVGRQSTFLYPSEIGSNRGFRCSTRIRTSNAMSECNHDDDDWDTIPKKEKKPRKTKDNNDNSKRTKKQRNPYINIIAPTSTDKDTPQQYEPFMVMLVGLPGSGKSTFAQSLVASMPNKFSRINQDELKKRVECERKVKQILSTSSEQRLCPIIDRCNFDAQQRSTWYRLAKAADAQGSQLSPTASSSTSTEDTIGTSTEQRGETATATTPTIEGKMKELKMTSSPPSQAKGIPVDVVVLDLPFEECLRRCKLRKGHETISPQQAQGVLKQIRRMWSPPQSRKNHETEKSRYRSLTIVRTEKERKECLQRILNQT